MAAQSHCSEDQSPTAARASESTGAPLEDETGSKDRLSSAEARSSTASAEGATDAPTENGDGEVDEDFDAAEGEEDSALDDDVDWEECYACPLTVRFTQEKIHPFFYRRGPIVNVVPKIRPVMHVARGGSPPFGLPASEAEQGEIYELVPPFDAIHCLRKGDELWSLDNRRLYALQLAAMQYWPQRCCVRLMSSDRLPRRKFKTQYRKFKTQSEGRAVHVCARYQKFESWSWFDRAVEVETYSFSQRLGVLLSVFELLPVLGALLYRTGLTGLASRIPLLVGFVLAFSIDLGRQKLPIIERRVSELHVKAVMDGDARPMVLCNILSWGQEKNENAVMSAPQFAAIMALALALGLPYVLGIAHDKVRSSLLSCWLGVACVLIFQLGPSLRNHAALNEFTGAENTITPRHRR